VELSPLVFEAAGDRDRVARAILDRVADEVVAFATASIKRLRIANRDVEIVLGGGIFRAEDRSFHRRIHSGVHRTAPRAVIRRLTAPPVVGAALLGLDAFHASPEAVLRLRRALTYRRLG
jgi:N-acetylglucosamine kinase-like BadF-type ATPase